MPLNDADLTDQLLLLLFAGYGTTASSLTLAVLLLLQHPESLAWLREEIDGVPWRPDDPDLDQLETLRRLNAVIKEVLRLVPYTIAPGRVIQVDIAATQRHGQTTTDGEAFRPERPLEAPLGGASWRPAWHEPKKHAMPTRMCHMGLIFMLSACNEPDVELC